MAKIKSQNDQRRYATFKDQHGRKWGAVVEKETGDPVGGIMPQFEAPWMPPPHIVRVVPGETGVVEIHYDELVREIREAHGHFLDQARNIAVLMYGEGAAQALETMPRELRHMVGDPPAPVEPVQAAKAGNKYVLGFSTQMPAWAEKFFGKEARIARQELEPDFPDAEDEVTEETLGNAIEGNVIEGNIIDDFEATNPLEGLNDEFDPDAVGGTRVPVGAGKRGAKRRTARED